MTGIDLCGLVVVVGILLFFALEGRNPYFITAFAIACTAASVYGFLISSWSFGIAEAIWALVALKRLHKRRT